MSIPFYLLTCIFVGLSSCSNGQTKTAANDSSIEPGYIRTYYILEGEEKTTAFYTEMKALPPQIKSKDYSANEG